jgi:hypothetical protein
MRQQNLFIPTFFLTVVVGVSWLTAPGLSAQESPSTGTAPGVVAYYFHGNTRCATCKKIEAYADEAIHQGFAEMLENGALTWRVVNVEESENRHFIDDFQLVTRSVVLAEYHNGAITRWKSLDKVWQLVRNKDDFTRYVQSETREFLGES